VKILFIVVLVWSNLNILSCDRLGEVVEIRAAIDQFDIKHKAQATIADLLRENINVSEHDLRYQESIVGSLERECQELRKMLIAKLAACQKK